MFYPSESHCSHPGFNAAAATRAAAMMRSCQNQFHHQQQQQQQQQQEQEQHHHTFHDIQGVSGKHFDCYSKSSGRIYP